MIKIECLCGTTLQFANESSASRGRCHVCGTRVAHLRRHHATTPAEHGHRALHGLSSTTTPSTAPASQSAPPTPLPPAERPKLQLRERHSSPTPPPETLGTLAASAAAVPEPQAVPVLQPVEEAAAKPESAPPQPAAPAEVLCAFHPDKKATHNCMNCGKPLCIECVRANGYYCGPQCKEAVSAREPRLQAAGQDGAVIDEKVGRTMDSLGRFLRRLRVPALLLLALAAAYFVYQWFWGAGGRVTASLAVSSEMQYFRACFVEPDQAVVQANNTLFLAHLPTAQKLWNVDLTAWEEKFVPPQSPAKSAPAEEEMEFGDQGWRDRLLLQDVRGDHILVRSSRQLLCFDRGGQLRWKYFDPNVTLALVGLHAGGVVCSLSERWLPGSGRRPSARAVHFAWADGSQTWSNNELAAPAESQWVQGERLIRLLAEQPGARSIGGGSAAGGTRSAPSVATLLGGVEEEADEETDSAPTAPAGQARPYRLQIVSLSDGTLLSEKTFLLAGRVRLRAAGDGFFLADDKQLLWFRSTAEPLWQATLPRPPGRVEGGESVVAVAVGNRVVAFDSSTGREKWSHDSLSVRRLAVAPDGSVYVTVEMDKEAASRGAAARYRLARISTEGIAYPSKQVLVLLKLDAADGRIRWGVKNIGREVRFQDGAVYVFDAVTRVALLASQGPVVGLHSVRSVSPRTGKDLWMLAQKGDVYQRELIAGGRVFVVCAEDPPAGRLNPVCNYSLQIIERK